MAAKTPVAALAKLKASRKPIVDALKPIKQLSLELWPDAVRGVPNAVLRGSLFSISKTRSTAKKRELLPAVDGIEIRFKGERFNQTDLDLFEMLLHLARLQPLGDQVKFTAYSLLKELGRGTGGKDHEDLKEDIARLMGGVVEITWTDIRKTFIGHLVADAYRDEVTQQYVVKFDSKMLGLYENGYSYVDWDSRKALGNNSLAKWCHGFYASHAKPYAYKVETIKNLCGSKVERLTDFKKMLRQALSQLEAVGAIKEWAIVDDLVHVNNAMTRTKIRHLAKKRATVLDSLKPKYKVLK